MKIARLNRKGYTAWGAKNTLKGVGEASMEVWKSGSMEVWITGTLADWKLDFN